MDSQFRKRILATPDKPQENSPLFNLLPGEIRSQIFSYALSDYPDPSPEQTYDADTCYTRPTYFAPRRSDTDLLRTCRTAYRESWFLPFTLKEQTHWLSSNDRAPPDYDIYAINHELHNNIEEITETEGEENSEIESLRVFAQMYRLEDGSLARLLSSSYLRPRSLTLTIRHADWWFWEDDEPLRFEGNWIEEVSNKLPNSLREFRIELESLQRKKDQIDKIANQMIDKWYFKRRNGDGAVFFADTEGGSWEVGSWSGNSTWHDQRWVRDETKEGQIDYYIVTVTFRLESAIMRSGGKVSETAKQNAERDVTSHDKLKLYIPGQGKIEHPRPYISLWGNNEEEEEEEDEEDEEEDEDEEDEDDDEDEDDGEDDDEEESDKESEEEDDDDGNTDEHNDDDDDLPIRKRRRYSEDAKSDDGAGSNSVAGEHRQ